MIPIPLTITFTVQGSNLPFGMPSENETATRGQHIDLRKEPGRVSELPEVVRHPQWAQILSAINDPKTSFQTIGCNCTVKENQPLILTDIYSSNASPAWLAKSYLQIGLAVDLGFPTLDLLYCVSGRLLEFLTQRAGEIMNGIGLHDINVVLAFEELLKAHVPVGHVLCIRCRVGGDSKAKALDRWAFLMTVIASFFETLQCT